MFWIMLSNLCHLYTINRCITSLFFGGRSYFTYCALSIEIDPPSIILPTEAVDVPFLYFYTKNVFYTCTLEPGQTYNLCLPPLEPVTLFPRQGTCQGVFLKDSKFILYD